MFALLHFIEVELTVAGIKPENITLFDLFIRMPDASFSYDAAIAACLEKDVTRFSDWYCASNRLVRIEQSMCLMK
ncbi:hypothetical protein [Burkholderia stabilis]|uniref:hypothetical protein n=1 Tax=Burkholderia stabilis TaxID=95485 RepID=UPI0015897DCA|nr:hypothetical protein [Burkholderia stabilis]